MMLKASNPSVSDSQANSFWDNYSNTGVLPKGFESLLDNSNNSNNSSDVTAKKPNSVWGGEVKGNQPTGFEKTTQADTDNEPSSKNYKLNDVGLANPTYSSNQSPALVAPQSEIKSAPPQSKSDAGMTDEQAKDYTINHLGTSVNQSIKTFSDQVQKEGVVSKGYNSGKELFNAELSKSSVARELYTEQAGVGLMDKADKGDLTKQQYYDAKMNLFLDLLPNAKSMTSADREILKKKYSNFSTEDLNKAIDKVKTADDKTYQSMGASVKDTLAQEKANKPKLTIEGNELKFAPMAQGTKSYALVDMSEKLLANTDENCKKALGGKDVKAYEKEYADSYINAYGEKNSKELSEAFVKDQEAGVQYVKTGVQFAGMGLVIATSGALAPVEAGAEMALGAKIVTGATLAVATYGGTAVGALNEGTREGGFSDKAKSELGKELAMNTAFFGVGAAGGVAGNAAKETMLLKECPKFLAYAGDYGTQAAAGVLGELALTGQIDIKGQSIGQTIALVSGIIAHKKMAGGMAAEMNAGVTEGVAGEIASTKMSGEIGNTKGSAALADVATPELQTQTTAPVRALTFKGAEVPKMDLSQNANQRFKLTETPEINDIAELHANSFKLHKEFANPKAQSEVSSSLDQIINHLEHNTVLNETKTPVADSKQVISHDGTVFIAEQLKDPNGAKMIACVDPSGKHTYLCATTKENVVKVNKVLEYMSQMDVLPADNRVIQKRIVESGKPAKEAINDYLAEKKANQEAALFKLSGSNLTDMPETKNVLNMNSPEAEAIQLTKGEAFKARLQGKDTYRISNDKKYAYICEQNAKPAAQEEVSQALDYISDRVKNEMVFGESKGEVELYRPVILPDGTQIARNSVREMQKYTYGPSEMITIMTPDGKKTFLPINSRWLRR